ncbi:MAG: tetratricopeptide repeat protein, partial [Chloroflexota bacterium]
ADGGMGKTRLALQVAQTLQPSFTHGCWFVPLVAVQNTDGVIAQIAATIGLNFLDGMPASHQLRGYLKQKQLLLVLDNLEHLLTDDLLDFITELLQAAPQIKILATSRKRLRLRPEHPYSLRGLVSTPQNDVAKQFFISRSAAHLDVSQNTEEVEEVEQICQLVDGIPLALELAASLTATLSTADILRALKKNIDILQADLHDVPARHSSLKEIYDASWHTLTEAEKAIIAKFSIFRNGATGEAMMAVTGATAADLQNLVNKSFLRKQGQRFDVHELMRQYSAEKLQGFPIEAKQETHRRYAGFYLDIFSRFSADSYPVEQWVADFENFTKSWHYHLKHHAADGLEQAIPPLWQYYNQQHRLPEAITLFQEARDLIKDNAALNHIYVELSRLVGLASFRLGKNQAGVEACFDGAASAGYPIPQRPIAQAVNIGLGYLTPPLDSVTHLIRPESDTVDPLTEKAVECFVLTGAVLYVEDDSLRSQLAVTKGYQISRRFPDLHPLKLAQASNLYVTLVLTNQQRKAKKIERTVRHMLQKIKEGPFCLAAYNSLVAPNFGRKSWDELLRDLDCVAQAYSGLDYSHYTGNASVLRGILHMLQGDWEAGIKADRDLLTLSQRTSNAIEMSWGLIGLGTFKLRMGRFEESETHYNQVLDLIQQGADLGIATKWTYADLALLFAKQQRWSEAKQQLAKIFPQKDIVFPINTQNHPFYVNTALAQLLVWEHDQTQSEWERFLDALSKFKRFAQIHPIAEPQLKWLTGRRLISKGRIEQGLRMLEAAHRGAEKLELPYVAGQIAADLCRYDPAASKSDWHNLAQQKFEQVGAQFDLEQLNRVA